MTRPASASIEFTVLGDPAPQGSKSAVVRGEHAVILEGRTRGQRAKFGAWRATVAQHAWVEMSRLGRITPLIGPVAVELLFVMGRPRSTKADQRWKAVSPDLDKLERAVLDSLKVGGVIHDDKQVVDLHSRKVMADTPAGPTGVRIAVRTVEHSDAPSAALTATGGRRG